MGGGDLNLKKSWHPHTMKNQEKVWKAEQAKSQEDKKLKDLRREIEEEKTREDLKQIGRSSGILPQEDKKLEWMYKSSNELINREEYLLGRNIDKSFEMLQAEEQRKDQNIVGVKQSINHVEHECIPFSIRTYRNMESTEQVDLQRKAMEDPLMLIKQREMESRKKLLENPVKLKELHRILKTDELLKKSKKVKKSKKSKKSKKEHKKRSTSSSSSDSDATDLDKELAKRYKKLNREEDLSLSKLLDAKFETITKELDKAAGSKRKKYNRHRSKSSESDHEKNRKSRSRDRERSKRKQTTHKSPRHRSPNNYQKRQNSNMRSPDEPRKRQYSTSPSIEREVRRISHSKKSRSSRSLSKDRRKINDHRSNKRGNTSRQQNYKDHETIHGKISRSPRRRSHSPRRRSHSPRRRSHSSHRRSHSSRRRSRSPRRKSSRSPRRRSRSPRRISSSPRRRSRSLRKRSRSPRRISNSPRRRSRSPRRISNSPRRRSRSPRRSPQSPRNSSRSPRRRKLSKEHNENKRNAQSSESKSSTTQKKLSTEEKEARLREMMENASWREEDRVKSVQQHRAANAREEEQYKNQDFDKEFINKEVRKAIATQSSIGSRIRSNLNNIQRTSAAMSANFTKK